MSDTVNNNFQYGSEVLYNGREATVVSSSPNADKITIMYNGQRVIADRNDLFGINNSADKKYAAQAEDIQTRIDDSAKYITKKQEEIAQANIAQANAIEEKHNASEEMYSILRNQGVSSLKDIQDKNAQAKYITALSKKHAASMAQIRSEADIQYAAHMVSSECIYQNRWNCQLGILKMIKNKFC